MQQKRRYQGKTDIIHIEYSPKKKIFIILCGFQNPVKHSFNVSNNKIIEKEKKLIKNDK